MTKQEPGIKIQCGTGFDSYAAASIEMTDQNRGIIPGISERTKNIKTSVRQFINLQPTFTNNRLIMVRFVE